MPAVLRVEDSTAVLNGLRFHYRDWENDGSPALLLLHAAGDCARDWDGFAEALAADFRVLALDQRGHGETSWAGDYSPETWLEDLDAFSHTLALRGIAVLGHGMGARHARQFALRHRSLVKRLILVDEPAGARALDDGSPGALCAAFRTPDEAFRVLSRELSWADERLLRRWLANKFREAGPGRWELRWDARMALPGGAAPASTTRQDRGAEGEVTCPTLTVTMGTPAGSQRSPAFPGEHRVSIPELHHPLLQQPGALVRIVSDWL